MQPGGTVQVDNNSAFNICNCSDTAGEVTDRRDLMHVRLREALYPRGLSLGRHKHANAYLSYILEGSYTESYRSNSACCSAGTLRFLPAGEVHSNLYDEGARCLLIELQPETLNRVRGETHVFDGPGEISSSQTASLARRLYAEFRKRDTAAVLAIEGLVLELLAEGVRAGDPASRMAPKWLRGAKDMIHSRFLDVPSLTEIARAVGVHPVHLSREFHRYFQVTVGEYMRKLRTDHASHLLSDSDMPLAEIADVCGFADQSHFSSTFKRTVGLTPARFRELNG